MSDFFEEWNFPELEEKLQTAVKQALNDMLKEALEDVFYDLTPLLKPIKAEVGELFHMFLNDGEWNWECAEDIRLVWAPKILDWPWQESFPIDLTLTPAAFVAAFKEYLYPDLGAETRADLVNSLREWTKAIAEAQALLEQDVNGSARTD